MSGAAGDRATAIFFALSQVAPQDRIAQLAQQCGEDPGLRQEVERLLAGLDLPDLERPGHANGLGYADGLALGAGTVIGDFTIVSQIGSGGTGVVHLARQRHPPRIVALKMLRREFLASTVHRRFEIEAELLAHLNHSGIAEIYTAHSGDETTPPFIAMELVNGPPLTDFADSRGLSIRDRVGLVARVCEAVQHAHQRGIIHRDLKPGNILVDADGQPKILDFGVARRVEQSSPRTMATETGQLIGTLAYMSPEQVQAVANTIDTRTDIYSLGVILFRLLAGRLPFAHDDPPLPELARRIVEDEPPSLGAVDPALRGDLEVIVARAMAKEKDRRYASAEGLGADLRRYLDGQPISASADSAWYLLRRQLGRYRLALGVSAAAIVVVSALAIYASVERSRADVLNARLQDELATSTIERGRLIGLNGNQPVAEALVWRELFRQPDSPHARWTLWEMYSREPSLWTHLEHEGGTQTVRFSPDGSRLLTTGRVDGSVHLLDATSGRLLRTFSATPAVGLRRAIFTRDGGAIVAGSEDGTLRVWDSASGALRIEIPKAVDRLHDFTLAADGTSVVAVAWGRVQVWSIETGQRLPDLPGLGDMVSMAAASPVAPLAVFGTDDGWVTVVDLARRAPVWRVRGHGGLVASLSFSPDGQVVASGGATGGIVVWRTGTGERLRAFRAENGRVRSVAFDASGQKLAAAGEWRTRVWDLTRPAEPPEDLGGTEGATEAHISPDGRAVATCNGGNGLVRLWLTAADSRLERWDSRSGSITGLAIGASAEDVFAAGSLGTISVRRDGRGWQPFLRTATAIGGFDVSSNGRWLVTAGTPESSGIWDARDGRRVAGLPGQQAARAIRFADEDRHIVGGENSGALVVWDWSDTGAANLRRFPSADGRVLAIARLGRGVLVGHGNRAIVIRDLRDGREISRFQASAAPFALAASPDGRWLAAGTYAGDVEVWNLQSSAHIMKLAGPTSVVTGLGFSPDGSLLAAGSRDGSTRLWDTRSGRALAVVASRRFGAERLQFLPDGRRIAIGYVDGEIEIRDLDYFFRFAAGNADYQLRRFRDAGEVFPRAGEVLNWSRQILAGR